MNKAINDRRKAYKNAILKIRQEAQNEVSGIDLGRTQQEQLWEKYESLKEEATKVVKESKKDSWDAFMADNADFYPRNMRMLYNYLRRWGIGSKYSNNGDGGIPIKNEQGELVSFGSKEYMDVWVKHISKVYTEPFLRDIGEDAMRNFVRLEGMEEGSNEFLIWQDSFLRFRDSEPFPAVTSTDLPTMDELEEVIKRAATFSAEGNDGFKWLVFKYGGQKAKEALLSVIRKVWIDGKIPGSWKEVIGVPIPKTNPPSPDLNNYRSISLSPVAVKALMSVIRLRLSEALKSRPGLLWPEQRGFQEKAECIEHSVLLHDALKRRQTSGMNTLLCFVDLRKAYDRVWRKGLLLKLARLGIRGNLLQIIRDYYEGDSISVRVEGRLSDPCILEWGVRQGCPLSPLLFDFFIDDIIDELKIKSNGVVIPGLGKTLHGLLWADDLVILAESEEEMKKSLQAVTIWLDTWRMEVSSDASGVATKCGILRVPFCKGESGRNSFRIQGASIPTVREYKYLGTILSDDLSFDKEVEARTKAGTRASLVVLKLSLVENCP